MSRTLQGKYAEKLEQENKQLKQLIEKIKEQIEIMQYNETYGKQYVDYNDLLDLLGEKENE